mgnify:CR=1 FL=1
MEMPEEIFDKVVKIAQSRGFVFNASSIYGGLRSSYDYGPLGVLLKNNIEKMWWKSISNLEVEIYPIDTAIIQSSDVWKASGHVGEFTDPMVDHKPTGERFRADQVPDHIKKVIQPLLNGFEIGTLATNLTLEQEIDINITKVKIDWYDNTKVGKAVDFFKTPIDNIDQKYQHVGIYSFRVDSLKKFISFPQSENEVKLNLEQWRALDHGMNIGVIYADNVPISVDTKEDLKKIESIIKSAK